MATGEARELKEQNPDAQITIVRDKGPHGNWPFFGKPVWVHNPYVTLNPDKDKKIIPVTNVKGRRPYYDHERIKREKLDIKDKHYFNVNFSPPTGDIFFSDNEKEKIRELKKMYGDYIFLNSTTKKTVSSDNRDWGLERWKKLAEILQADNIRIVQTRSSTVRAKRAGVGKGDRIGIKEAETPEFRDLCMFVAAVKGVVTSEGGVNHLAAALDKKTVSIFGGRVQPSILGYKQHTNLYVDIDGSPCWRNSSCEHCKKCMELITPEMVAESIYNTMH
jgi:ADP-heptose:LPS heptosyltransferase